MSRAEFSSRTKAAAYTRAEGRCECGCNVDLKPGDVVEFDHIVADAFRPDNSLDNCQVLLYACHKAKTKRDVRAIAKAKRVQKKHTGMFRPPRHIVPGSKASKWKKPLHGNAVLRTKE